MTVPSPAELARPLIAWLGPPPARAVVEGISRVARLTVGFSPEARLVAVWAPSGLDALADLPPGASRLPVVATTDRPPTTEDRLLWIEAGADDLVGVADLPDVIARRLGRTAAPQAPSGAEPRVVELVEGAAEPFPPLPVVPAEGSALARVNDYVQRLMRYLARRDAWVAKFGPEALAAHLELSLLRDQVPVTPDGRHRVNTFGQGPSRDLPALDWPVMVRRSLAKGGRRLEIAEGTIAAVGTDGILLDVEFRSTPRQRLVVDLAITHRNNAQFLVEARMQRRVGLDRWHIGAVVAALRLLSLPRR